MTIAGMTGGRWAPRLDRAREVVAAHLAATPLVASPALGDGLLLKLETWQPTGSFKVRGALAALSAAGNTRGVVTASTGNHALGVAWAARRLGRPATVVVPASTSPAKLAALRQFPATVIVHGDSYEHAEQHARSLADDGLRYLSASSDPDVIAGQATAGTELLAELPGTITVACGVGGGGLASGLGLAASRSRRMTIIGRVGRRENVGLVRALVVAADGVAGQRLQPAGVEEFHRGRRGDHAHVPPLVLGVLDELRKIAGWPAAAGNGIQHTPCWPGRSHNDILADAPSVVPPLILAASSRSGSLRTGSAGSRRTTSERASGLRRIATLLRRPGRRLACPDGLLD